MLVIDDIIVSDDLYLVRFCCHLDRCQGACCVAGDAGAPLEEDEISLLEDHLDALTPFMTERGVAAVKEQGVFDYDALGNFVTPLVKDAECAFCNFDNGLAYCAIEKAYEEGAIRFRKPISCHLYPVRITRFDHFEAVNYHKWPICKPALKYGKKQGMMVYQFLKVALIRKYGENWYRKLDEEIRKRLEAEK